MCGSALRPVRFLLGSLRARSQPKAAAPVVWFCISDALNCFDGHIITLGRTSASNCRVAAGNESLGKICKPTITGTLDRHILPGQTVQASNRQGGPK